MIATSHHGKRCFALLVLLAAATAAKAEPPSLDGRWTGRTQCPLGAVDIEVVVDATTGMFSHGGYGPNAVRPDRFPVNLSFSTGWEGEWVYFRAAEGDGRASWPSFSGLLAKDGHSIHVRGIELGDCREFRLVRAVDEPARAPVVEHARGVPGGREPTEGEMRSAVEYAFQGGGDAREIDVGLSGARITIDQFQKLGCVRADGKPGYACDYAMRVNMKYHSNEGTAAGNAHAGAVQDLYDRMVRAAGGSTSTARQGRFLYAESLGRWVRLDQ